MLKTAMKNDENLAKAYKMVKNTMAAVEFIEKAL